MKKEKTGSEILGEWVGILFLVSPLLAWWVWWIVPHYTGKDINYLLTWLVMIGFNLVIPTNIKWIQTLVLLLLSVGIWFNLI